MSLTTAQQQALLNDLAQITLATTNLGMAISALPVDVPVVIPPPVTGVGPGPNLPAGLTLISAYAFPDTPPLGPGDFPLSDGWHAIYNDAGNLTNPLDPTLGRHVLSVRYPQGFIAGSAPGTLYRGLAAAKLYCAFRVKVATPWQGNPDNVNKLVYFFAGTAGSLFLCFYGTPGGPYHLRVFPQFVGIGTGQWLDANLDTTPFPVDGQYHAVELYADHGGVVAWALDGQIQGNHSGVAMPAAGFSELHLTPVWGGVDGVKQETDFLTFDGLYLAGR